ncbi:hypothetical protein D3C71_1848280 [compost metagenome]
MPLCSPTSSPSKIMLPESDFIMRIISRASVDLPQPDSPTIPSTSPFLSLKLTPSTACTAPSTRPKKPLRIGKYFFRFSTISMGCWGPPRSAAITGAAAEVFTFIRA